jgi:hypothetical protein
MNAMQAAIAFHFYFDNVEDVTDDVVYDNSELEGIGQYVRLYKVADPFLLSVQNSGYGLSVKQRRVIVRKMVENLRRYMEDSGAAITLADDGTFVLDTTLAAPPRIAAQPVAPSPAQQSSNVTPRTSAIRVVDAAFVADFQAGTYTVELPGRHVTLKVLPVTDKDNITHVASVLIGPDNSNDFIGFAWIRPGNVMSVWQRTAHMTHAITALQQFLDGGASLECAYCNRCGRKLTVPVSLYAGLGPECRKKAGM